MPTTDFYSDPSIIASSRDYFDAMRARGAIVREPFHDTLMVTGYDEALEILVNKDGSLQNIRILKSAHPCTDEAILTAFGRMPRWNPAEANGCPVRLRCVIPVRIRWE